MNRKQKQPGPKGVGVKTPNTLGDFVRTILRVAWRAILKPGPVTLEGAIFILLAFLIGLAATNTGTNLLYLIFSLMMAFMVVSGVLSSRTLKRLSVERSLPKHIVAGEAIDVRLTVRNGKRFFGSYGLQVSDTLRDGTTVGYSYFLRVPNRDQASVSYPCVFHRRGQYQFDHVEVTTTYPFGLVRRTITIRAAQEVLVYPQILPWDRLGINSPPDFGERESRHKGPGSSLYGIREQQPSEGARWIHWKKTAQMDRLMRREFEAEEKKHICLVLDNALQSPDDPVVREAFERAIVMAASVAHHLLLSDHQVELVTRSGRVPYSSGPHQRYRILRALALIEPVAPGDKTLTPPSVSADTAIVVFRCEGQNPLAAYPRGTQLYSEANLVTMNDER
jgi:uncharacterized protein (DUF58 family)